ncbi:hypothetical protein LT679_15790 [Mucilaginibacter roseus]|uniref:Lipoprotein n=1 Tax=Mucilaginibacter roseus TaxID=1528868 RepID=A0ABS8U4P4_9SPHI|nr:hypothetical protein [Mucilaginibacter roseus]MCD8742076.1 hypothetical protein [Mucilaginibacter roseus]
MKIISLLLLLTLTTFSFSCNQANINNVKDLDSVKRAILNGHTYDKHNDSVNLSIDDQDTILYSKKSLDSMITFYPELAEDFLDNPDITYAKRHPSKLAYDKGFSFESEVGQDSYYEIYAYILNLQPKLRQYHTQKRNLSKIYQDINYIYQKLQQGGTYFGHTYARIPAYVMYSLTVYDYKKEFPDKVYNIDKQKKLYTDALKQYISDELDNDMEFTQNEKPVLKKELFQTVDEIDSLISERFFLAQAQEFQYAHY